MTLAVGNDHKLYYSSGTPSSPTWTSICIVGNVNLNLTANTAEVDLRCTNWLMNLASKLTGDLSMTLAAHVGNATWTVLRAAFFARTVLQMAIANANIATPTTEYFKAYMFFSAFPWNQPTQELSDGEATMALAYVEETNQVVSPTWNVVA